MADPKDPGEEDKVDAAYENISKKLDSIRNGEEIENEDGDDDESSSAKATEDKDELEEWKGPKGVKKEDEESEPAKKWKPVEDDPLDEDEKDEPGTLDDLTEEDEFDIPNLKDSRQEGSNIGYNAPSEKSSMDNNDPNNFFSQANMQHPPKRANKFHLLVLVLIGVAVIGFTVYILKGGFGEINIANTPSPSPSAVETPSPTPTPTPEPEIDRSKFTIRVLNGTSTTGLAGDVTDKLKELGYNTANPGNATNSAFTQTLVRVKEGDEFQALLQRLIADLIPDYEAEQGPDLSNSSSNDAEVILGTK